MGNSWSDNVTRDDHGWFNSIMSQAVKEKNSLLDDSTLQKYLFHFTRTNNTSALDAQTCVFIAYLVAKKMSSISGLGVRDMQAYGRVLQNLLSATQLHKTFTKVVPEWLIGLKTSCLNGAISTPDTIVETFESNSGDQKLQYCKTHQGIPFIVSEHSTQPELTQCHSQPILEIWQKKQDLNISDEIKRLDNIQLLALVGTSIANTGDVIVSRQRDGKRNVIVYQVVSPKYKAANFHEIPELCKYANLRSRMRSKYINTLLGFTNGKQGSGPCLIMEDTSMKSLFQYLVDTSVFKQYLSWAKRLRIAHDIAAGLKDLHENGVIHKMLNPYTVLLNSDLTVKLTCFGMEGVDPTSFTSRGWCTSAPEVRLNKQHSSASDVFAFGLILMELAGYRVQNNDDFGELLAISTTSCPKWFQWLTIKCTMKNPLERPTVEEILKLLEEVLKDCHLDAPKDYVHLVELDKKFLKQSAIKSNDDIVNVFNGKYKGMDVLIKRPNDTPKNKNITPLAHLMNEVVISTRVQSQNIVKQYGIFDSNSSSPAVVVEDMDLGSLFDFIGRIDDKSTFDQDIILHIANCIAQALLDLHDMDYVHGDVHPKNVFLNSIRQAKLGNLVLAQPAGMLLSDSLFEYIEYLAPEVKEEKKPFSKAADVYSFGKLLMILDLCQQNASEDYEASSEWLKNLTSSCCDQDPCKRPTMKQVQQVLKTKSSGNAPDFVKIKMRDTLDIEQQLQDVPTVNHEEIVFLSEIIGKGAYGAIQCGNYKGLKVAVKVFGQNSAYNLTETNNYVREVTMLHRCQGSEHVIRLIGIVQNERQIVMELIDSSLTHYITVKAKAPMEFTWHERIGIGLKMTQAIADTHKCGVVHLDIKSLNFVISKDGKIVKLIDFGQSQLVEEAAEASNEVLPLGNVGTSAWKSPELILQRVYTRQADKVDIYALGVIFSELDSLQLPSNSFAGMNGPQIEKEVSEGRSRHLLSVHCPTEFKQLALKCMHVNASKRPTAQALLKSMQDIFNTP